MKTGRKILIAGALVLLTLALTVVALFRSSPDLTSLNPVHRYLAFSVYNTWTKYIAEQPEEKRSIVSYDSLMNSLNFAEKDLAEKVFSIDPKILGFKGPFYGKKAAENLVSVPSVKLSDPKGSRETGIQYCPTHSYRDYERMMNAMFTAIGKRLYIDSGYRSPGRQAYLVFYYLVLSNDYNLTENAKWIAMPGYSEHGSPLNNAIDFVTAEGMNGFEAGQSAADFEKLKEYEWLLQNAGSYNFYLSYPKNNTQGVAFEPWHWHWDGDLDTALRREVTVK